MIRFLGYTFKCSELIETLIINIARINVTININFVNDNRAMSTSIKTIINFVRCLY